MTVTVGQWVWFYSVTEGAPARCQVLRGPSSDHFWYILWKYDDGAPIELCLEADDLFATPEDVMRDEAVKVLAR